MNELRPLRSPGRRTGGRRLERGLGIYGLVRKTTAADGRPGRSPHRIRKSSCDLCSSMNDSSGDDDASRDYALVARSGDDPRGAPSSDGPDRRGADGQRSCTRLREPPRSLWSRLRGGQTVRTAREFGVWKTLDLESSPRGPHPRFCRSQGGCPDRPAGARYGACGTLCGDL